MFAENRKPRERHNAQIDTSRFVNSALAGAFLAASLASAVAPFAYARDGWPMVTLVGVVPPMLALSFYLAHTRAEMRRVTP